MMTACSRVMISWLGNCWLLFNVVFGEFVQMCNFYERESSWGGGGGWCKEGQRERGGGWEERERGGGWKVREREWWWWWWWWEL